MKTGNPNAPAVAAEIRTGGRKFAETPRDYPLAETISFSGNPDYEPPHASGDRGGRPDFGAVYARAHQLWHRSGRTNDQLYEHWPVAQRQLDEEFRASGPRPAASADAPQ